MSDLVDKLRLVEKAHKAFALCYEAADRIEELEVALRDCDVNLDYNLEEAAVSDWRPIATAPKDGRDILVYRPRENEEYDAHVGIDNWYIYGMGCWAHSRRDQQPTHWMPLPKPPVQ